MKLNRTWAMVVAIVMALTLSLSGTLAYLSDTDSDVNVMVLGNVQIEQHEQERDGNGGLQDFSNFPVIYPAADVTGAKESITVNDYNVSIRTGSTYIDKIVTVENTGKSDAYVRTIFAFPEAGDFNTTWNSAEQWFHWNGMSDTDTTTPNGWMWGKDQSEWPGNTDNWDVVENVTISGKVYDLYVATNKNVIEPKEKTAPSLLGCYVDVRVDNEVDAMGNVNYTFTDKNGKVYNLGDISQIEILVATQAVQADGFDNAWTALDAGFGDITATNHPWMKGVEPVVAIVSSDEELNAALEDPTVSEIVLNSGNYGVIDVRVNRTLTISAAADADVKIAGVNGQTNNNNTNLTIKGVTIDNSKQTEGWFTGTAQNIKPCVGVWGGDYTFEDCVFRVTGASGAETGVMSWWTTNHGVMNFKNCTFNGDDNNARGMQIYGNYDLNVEGCTFNTAKDYSIKYVGSKGCAAVLKNNKVYNTTNFVQLGSAAYPGSNYSITFTGNDLANNINHVLVDNVENQTIIINGVEKAATAGVID